MNLDDLTQNVEGYAQHLARRTYSREGIEMFLALGDLFAETPRETASQEGEVLAHAVQEVAARLRTQDTKPKRALSLALELAAFRDFGSSPLEDQPTKRPKSAHSSVPNPEQSAELNDLMDAFRRGHFVRSVNFHNTFAEDKEVLQAQLSGLSQRFKSIGLKELEALIAGTPWTDERPPILLVFYEGYRNHFDIAQPLLEALGLTGVFCLIPGFIDTPVAEQASFAAPRLIDVDALEYPDRRLAMTWDEVRELSAQHDMVCHTLTHADANDPETDVRLESVGAIERLEEELGQEVNAFVWRRGAAWGEVPRADACLREANIHLLLSSFKVERLPSD